ncbi:MAG: flagellar cap protein FliD N-terminal domain-containing protein [Pirellulaceae bacterium]
MGRIQSSVGLVTGVAIEDTVNQLMRLNGIPRDRLVSRNAGLQSQQVALTELTALVVGVQLTTDRLGQSSLFSSTTVSSSKTDVLTARSLGSPKAGSYSFIPVQQAQSQQLTSSLFTSADHRLNEGELVIHTGGFLDEAVNLDALNDGAGVSRGRIRITDRSGSTQTIDLRFAQTTADVVDKINANNSLGVVAKLDGDRFVLTDVTGGLTANLQVEDIDGGTTAADLGLAGISTTDTTANGSSVYGLHTGTAISTLRDGLGLDLGDGELLRFELQDGSTLSFSSELDSATASFGQLIDEINAAADGKFEVAIAADGKSLALQDLTTGTNPFAVTSPSGSLAGQLGFDGDSVAGGSRASS